MLGRRFSSSMSFVTGSAYSNIRSFEFRVQSFELVPDRVAGSNSKPETRNSKQISAKQSAQPRWQHAPKFTFHCFVYFAVGFVNGGEDHVLKHLDVAFFDGFWI